MFEKIATILLYTLAITLFIAFHYLAMTGVLPYMFFALILGGVNHVIVEVRAKSAEAIALDETAVKAMIDGIKKYDKGDD